MESVLKIQRYFNWSRDRWFIYLLLAFSTLCWFEFVYDMQSYRPWKYRFGRAIADTVTGHFFLYLAMVRIPRKLRILFIAILFLNSIGFTLIWALVHPIAGLIALGSMSRLIYWVVTNK